MKSMARFSRSRISSSSESTCAWTETSSADTASSAISTAGSIASARAMQMRCRWPPENWCGYRSSDFGSSRTSVHQLLRAGHRIARRRAVVHRAFHDGLSDGPARIERTVGVLEDDLHAAPQRVQLRARNRREVGVADHDAPARRLDQPRDAARDGRLAGTGFPDDAERLALPDRQASRRPPRQRRAATAEPAACRIRLGHAASSPAPRAPSPPRDAWEPGSAPTRSASACNRAWASRAVRPSARPPRVRRRAGRRRGRRSRPRRRSRA